MRTHRAASRFDPVPQGGTGSDASIWAYPCYRFKGRNSISVPLCYVYDFSIEIFPLHVAICAGHEARTIAPR